MRPLVTSHCVRIYTVYHSVLFLPQVDRVIINMLLTHFTELQNWNGQCCWWCTSVRCMYDLLWSIFWCLPTRTLRRLEPPMQWAKTPSHGRNVDDESPSWSPWGPAVECKWTATRSRLYRKRCSCYQRAPLAADDWPTRAGMPTEWKNRIP